MHHTLMHDTLPALRSAPDPTLAAFGHPPGAELWVFAYGSLMWNPGFAHLERHPALLRGWHRAFCVLSFRHRGTAAVPGAVLGLDAGGACRGIVYRVAAEAAADTLTYLWDREMLNYCYLPRRVPVRLGARDEGPWVTALTFTVDRRHRQYAGRPDLDALERLVRQGVGESGRNTDYVRSTVAHLRELGIHDRRIEALAARLDGQA